MPLLDGRRHRLDPPGKRRWRPSSSATGHTLNYGDRHRAVCEGGWHKAFHEQQGFSVFVKGYGVGSYGAQP